MRAIVLLARPLLPYVSKVTALRVISVALLTAIAAGVLAVVASLYLTKLYQVSDFEGGRGMLIFFALAPLGLIVGFIIGLVVALATRAAGFRGFVKAQGIAVGIALALAATVSGVLYLAADHPPKLDGKSLALEFELKIPPALKLPAEASVQTLHASLYANNRDNILRRLITTKSQSATATFSFPAKLRYSRRRLIAIFWFPLKATAVGANLSS